MQCPTDINNYQQNIYGVDRGEQICQHSAGFSSKAHFKKCYKIGHFGFSDFGFMNPHIAWNMSCKRMVHRGQELLQTLKMWQFCVVAAEEMMTYYIVNPQDKYCVANIASGIMRLRRDGHYPCLDLSKLKQQRNVK